MNVFVHVLLLSVVFFSVGSVQAQFNLGKALSAAGDVVSAVKGVSSETVTDLQTAYAERLNAAAKFKAFAAKAKTDGYLSVQAACLAAEASATIQAKKIAAELQSASVAVKDSATTPTVQTTFENLQKAIKDGSAAYNSDYPKFARKATKKGDVRAARLFQQVVSTEMALGGIFTKASANLVSWKAAGQQFVVCPTCGYTAEATRSFDACPLCDALRSSFTTYK